MIFLRHDSLPTESNRINFLRMEAFHLSFFLFLVRRRLIKSTFPLAKPQSFRRTCSFFSREESDKTVGRCEETKKRKKKRRGRWEEYDLRFARICEAFDTPHSDFTLGSVHCRWYYIVSNRQESSIAQNQERERERESSI